MDTQDRKGMTPIRTLSLALAAALAPAWTAASAAPGLTALDPASAPAGTPGLSLRVLGTGLVSGSVVCWRGAARPTTGSGLLELRAQLSAGDLASPGSAAVTVALPPLLGTATCGLGSLLGPLTFAVT